MRKIWPFLFYFFFFAAYAALLPYLVLYFGELGLSGRQIGILTALPPLVTLISAPLWTGVADATHRHRSVLSLSLFISILAALAEANVTSYWALLPIIVVFAFALAPASPLADSATMNMLAGEEEQYGRVRVGGSFGWGIASLIAGIVLDQTGLRLSFYMYAVFMLVTMLVGFKLVFAKAQTQISMRRGISSLLAKPRWILFLSMAFIGGIGLASINTYMFYYMGELGSSKTLMGIAMVISTLSEIPALFFSNRLIVRFKAHGLMILGLLLTGIRLLLFAALNQPMSLVVIQLLQGLTFPIIWVAGVTYANENAPLEMSATAQGLFGSMLMGFGAAAGNLLGGMLIDAYSTQFMYLFFGALLLVSLLVITLIELRLPVATHEPSI